MGWRIYTNNPDKNNEICASGVLQLVGLFDPDFVYAYPKLNPSLVNTIDRLCCPIAILGHSTKKNNPDQHSFIPDWGLHFESISSLSTVPSPQVLRSSFFGRELDVEITVATQYWAQFKNRFWADNFGTGFHTRRMTYGIPGLYKTICLVPQNLPKNNYAGNERCTSLTDMLCMISSGKVMPVATYATAHSEQILRSQPYKWSGYFNLFIGKSVLDRIHFWNARHFSPTHIAPNLGSLILDIKDLADLAFISQIGQYLNNQNFIGRNNCPAQVCIRSHSYSERELHFFVEKLRKHTYNSVNLNSEYNLPALPESQDLTDPYSLFVDLKDSSRVRLREQINRLTAKEPSHFVYVPPKHRSVVKGQWIVELDIQRHNNITAKDSVDFWSLPRRRRIVKAFTNNVGKITFGHRLAVLPTTLGFHSPSPAPYQDYLYSLFLPDDETFFRRLVIDVFNHSPDDLRSSETKALYEDLAISDKGQYLRGVVSMFGNLSDAHEALTNKFWRGVLRASKPDSAKYLMFNRGQLEAFLPTDRPTKEKLRVELGLSNIGKVAQYMKGTLTDTLERFVNIKVFFWVHQWRCTYCGHTNIRTFDSMQIRNVCDVCLKEYFAPIDLEWTYQLNEFVYRSLVAHTGLPVLWTLGHLNYSRSTEGFWYLPEVDVYEVAGKPETKKEIDLLCMLNGKFIAAEVKLSAAQLVQNSARLDSFVAKMNAIKPDIAVISCERYCELETDFKTIKEVFTKALKRVRKRLNKDISLNIIVATDTPDFDEYPSDLGWIESRTDNIQ